MTDVPNYIVVRAHPDLPPGFLPPHMEGRWYDGSEIPRGGFAFGAGDAVAVPAGRFEVRESDGAVAEVWEVRP